MPITKSILILGTHTDVGKTWFSAFLTHYLKADYWKPIQTGQPTDNNYIQQYIKPNCKIHPSTYTFSNPISPHLASKIENQEIEISKIKQEYNIIVQNCQAEFLIVETAGGVCTPINHQHTNLDLSCALNIPTLLITKAYLGCLNHAIASYHLIKKTKFLGWVINSYDQYPYTDYIQYLLNYSKSPLFYQINSNSTIYDYPDARTQLLKAINKSHYDFS